MENKIKEIRASKGMTQKELASKSGVARTVISQLENGSRKVITTDTMRKLSNALFAIENIERVYRKRLKKRDFLGGGNE